MTRSEARAEFRRRLNIILSQRRTTPFQVSKSLGISYDIVYRWSVGRCVPRADSLRMLCDHLKVSADYLLGVGQ